MTNVDDVCDQWQQDEETAQVCGDALREEVAMPARLSVRPSGVSTPCVQRQAAGSGAAAR